MIGFFEIVLIAISINLITWLLYKCIKWIISVSILSSIILTFFIILFIWLFFPSLFKVIPVLNSIDIFNTTMKSSIEVMLMVICSVSAVYLVFGGFKYTNSHGNPSKMQDARQTVNTSLIMLIPFTVAEFFVFFFIPPLSADVLSISSLLIGSLGILFVIISIGIELTRLKEHRSEDRFVNRTRPTEAFSESSGEKKERSEALFPLLNEKMSHSIDKQHTYEAVKADIKEKEKSKDFDVFVCYNKVDKSVVLSLAKQLRERGILPWFDEWELRPGLPWQRLLEEQISRIMTVAVCIGQGGVGPWQRQELDAFLHEFVDRGCPVIPVILQMLLKYQNFLYF